MASVADQIAGQIPTVVSAGVTLKTMNAVFGTTKKTSKKRRKR